MSHTSRNASANLDNIPVREMIKKMKEVEHSVPLITHLKDQVEGQRHRMNEQQEKIHSFVSESEIDTRMTIHKRDLELLFKETFNVFELKYVRALSIRNALTLPRA